VLHYRDVVLPLKRKLVAHTLLEYNAMHVGVPQLLQAKRDQVESESAYIEQLRQYWTLRNQAAALLAGRLGSELTLSGTAGTARELERPRGH
jgi:hypothetical protein